MPHSCARGHTTRLDARFGSGAAANLSYGEGRRPNVAPMLATTTQAMPVIF